MIFVRSFGLSLLAVIALVACDKFWDGGSERGMLTLSGTVDAHQVDLSFQAGGRILRLNTDEGRKVQVSEVVAELAPKDYELALSRARAQENSAQKALAVLQAGSRPQDIRSAEAALLQTEADLHFANAEVKRNTDLVARHFVSQEALDHAIDQADVAVAKVEQAKQNLSLLREGPRKEDIARAAADYAAARAAVAIAEQQLAYVKLVSPVAGVVSVRLSERGQVVAAGQAVFRVAELDRPWVRAYLGEKDLPRVKLGQTAEVRVDGLPGKSFAGRLSFISPEAEFTPKTVETKALRVDLVYRIRVDVDNAEGQLKIGMPADVRLAVEK
ncbi:MAG: efflux RND transporter periplasmic adaptor subunit [Burkholderiales bacterium]